MVACGLEPGRSNSSNLSLQSKQRFSNLNKNGRRSLNEIVTNSVRGSITTNDSTTQTPQHSTSTAVKSSSRFSSNIVCVLIDFALKLMKTLEMSSCDDYFKQYDKSLLRVGIAHGVVMAGVIGSSKPLYDVWGNTVNMASRMESKGAPGKIQVTKATAQVLETFGIACESNGLLNIKNIGMTPAYFVKFNEKYELIKMENVDDNFSTKL